MTLPMLNALIRVERRLLGMDTKPAGPPKEGDMPPLPPGTRVVGAAEFLGRFGLEA